MTSTVLIAVVTAVVALVGSFVTWRIPDGIKAPTVSFRQRPAGLLTLIRRLARRIALAQRTPTP